MSLRWAGVARVVAQGFSTRTRPRAAGARVLESPGPPGGDRRGRAWRGSTFAGGPPWLNIARARPILLAAAAFPGTSPTPVKDNAFRAGDGASHREPSGATRALVASGSVALLSLGCKDEREKEAWCIPGKGSKKSCGKSVQARKKATASKHDFESMAAKHGAKGGRRSKVDGPSWNPPVINEADPADRAFDLVSVSQTLCYWIFATSKIIHVYFVPGDKSRV